MGGIVFRDINTNTNMIGQNGQTSMTWMNINNMVKNKLKNGIDQKCPINQHFWSMEKINDTK
jgi:hypothetical protein